MSASGPSGPLVFKSNVILKLHISSMLPVTSAIQSDILDLYL